MLALEPLDDYLVVEPLDEDVEDPHGPDHPAERRSALPVGLVTAIGIDSGGVEPGDKVLFPKDAGFDVRLGGVGVKVLRRRELIARVHD